MKGQRHELRRWLIGIDGIGIPESAIEHRPTISLDTLAKPDALNRFVEILDWVLTEQRRACAI